MGIWVRVWILLLVLMRLFKSNRMPSRLIVLWIYFRLCSWLWKIKLLKKTLEKSRFLSFIVILCFFIEWIVLLILEFWYLFYSNFNFFFLLKCWVKIRLISKFYLVRKKLNFRAFGFWCVQVIYVSQINGRK